MLSASQWLDLFKEIKELSTDGEAAEVLEISKQTVSHWRQERFQIGVYDAIRLGMAINVSPLYVIVASQYHRDGEAKHNEWLEIARHIDCRLPRRDEP